MRDFKVGSRMSTRHPPSPTAQRSITVTDTLVIYSACRPILQRASQRLQCLIMS